MGEASHIKKNTTPKFCMKLKILFLVLYLLYDLYEITLLANANKEHESGVKMIIFYTHSQPLMIILLIYGYVHFRWPTSIANS